MIRYLVDSSALWRILRDGDIRAAWAEAISNGAVGSCQPQRCEFRRSARDRDEFDAMSRMFDDLYPDVTVHKSAWKWIEAVQYRLSAKGRHRGLSVVDLVVSATAAHHGLIILHDDHDFATIAVEAPDLTERNVNRLP